MSDLPVIPTPPSQRWREFRVIFVPPIVFIVTLITIFLVWRDYVSPPSLTGQVEPIVSAVTARNAGILTNIFVKRFQEVEAGQVLAEVHVTDHRRYDTELELLRSEISLSQLRLGSLADRQRLALEYENLRTTYMRQQTELEMARAQLPHAQFDVDLSKRLLADKVVSDFEYHYFLSSYDSLKAQISQLTTNVAQLEEKLTQAKETVETAPGPEAMREIVAHLHQLQDQQKHLEALGAAPLLIEAPISGVVTDILHRPGENLLPGNTILTISSKRCDRIVGYLKPPLGGMEPKAGMTVQIRPRSQPRLSAESRISGVGASFEVITNHVFIRPNMPAEIGLPVAVDIPDTMRNQLRPGELIDIRIKQP
jgi:multidrug resistance efflux pump